MTDIYYTEDLDNIKDQGLTFYNDPDETVMELFKDGKVIVSYFINDFCDEVGLNYEVFLEDKCKVYDMFISYCHDQDWV